MRAFRTLGSERGAILIQTAVAGLVLISFSAFVIDYGIFWVSRNQAQNAADAGAAAGALARAYDDSDDPPDPGGVVVQSASQVAQANLVWTASATPEVSFDCPPGANPGPCVRVDVYRDGEFDSAALPTIFGSALGISSQGVRATASAQVAVGNATDCLRPLAMPDRWIEHRPVDGPWAPDSVFQRYAESGPAPGALLTPHDDYVPPSAADPGSGLTSSLDLGLQIQLSVADPTESDPITPGWVLPLQLPGSGSYDNNLDRCSGQLMTVGQQVLTDTSSLVGPTTESWGDLMVKDPGASWNAGTRRIDGSCAPSCAPVSPRLVVLALFAPDSYQLMRATGDWSSCPGGARCINIVNIVGFFIDHVVGPGVAVGYLTLHPGLVSTGSPTVDPRSSFLRAITLVR
jgi:Flp pilus assembly protein TadG